MFAKKLKSREKFLLKNPTLVGVVGNYRFYEHPFYGDEYPLLADDGKNVYVSCFYDLPTIWEIADLA